MSILTPGRFSVAKGGTKSSFDLQFAPWGGAYSRALKAESHLSEIEVSVFGYRF